MSEQKKKASKKKGINGRSRDYRKTWYPYSNLNGGPRQSPTTHLMSGRLPAAHLQQVAPRGFFVSRGSQGFFRPARVHGFYQESVGAQIMKNSRYEPQKLGHATSNQRASREPTASQDRRTPRVACFLPSLRNSTRGPLVRTLTQASEAPSAAHVQSLAQSTLGLVLPIRKLRVTAVF